MGHEHERVVVIQYAEMFEAHAIEITEAFAAADESRLRSVLSWVRRNSTALALGTATLASGAGGVVAVLDKLESDPLPEVIVTCLVQTNELTVEADAALLGSATRDKGGVRSAAHDQPGRRRLHAAGVVRSGWAAAKRAQA